MPTAQTIIDNALLKLGVYGPGETIATADRAQGLTELNLMIGQWQTERRFAYYTENLEFPIVTSSITYTIGPSAANFAVPIRPLELLAANLIRPGTPPTRVPLAVWTVQDYVEIPNYQESGEEPAALYYKTTFPNGTLYPLPYPANTATALANTFELYFKFLLSAFADLNTTSYNLPPGYENAITLSLVEVFGPLFGKAVPIEVLRQAARGRRGIQSVNASPPKVSATDSGLPRADADSSSAGSPTTRTWR